MPSPIRFAPIAPPPVPDFAQIAKTQKGGSSLHQSPGFSLKLGKAGSQPSRPTSAADEVGGLPGLIVNQVRGVQSMQSGADAMVNTMLTGGDVNESEVLTAVQKADLAFRMLLQIRNKLMDAYREVQQIQI